MPTPAVAQPSRSGPPTASAQPPQSQQRLRAPAVPVVALAAWLLPGAGYWLIGQRGRGILVGATIITLFLAGTLIGGVRAIQVPGYGEDGGRLYIVKERRGTTKDGKDVYTFTVREHRTGEGRPSDAWIGTNFRALLVDVGNKPWSICQVLTGPVAIAGGAGSVWASRPPARGEDAPGVLSHSRINEIAVLYTAVAGMLNLLVIIDSAARAARGEHDYAEPDALPAAAAPVVPAGAKPKGAVS
jgi:hypothetical protein